MNLSCLFVESAKKLMGMDDVFEANIALSLAILSSSPNSFLFTSESS